MLSIDNKKYGDFALFPREHHKTESMADIKIISPLHTHGSKDDSFYYTVNGGDVIIDGVSAHSLIIVQDGVCGVPLSIRILHSKFRFVEVVIKSRLKYSLLEIDSSNIDCLVYRQAYNDDTAMEHKIVITNSDIDGFKYALSHRNQTEVSLHGGQVWVESFGNGRIQDEPITRGASFGATDCKLAIYWDNSPLSLFARDAEIYVKGVALTFLPTMHKCKVRMELPGVKFSAGAEMVACDIFTSDLDIETQHAISGNVELTNCNVIDGGNAARASSTMESLKTALEHHFPISKRIIMYRTEHSNKGDFDYVVGQTYDAPLLDIGRTECAAGIYLTTHDVAKQLVRDGERVLKCAAMDGEWWPTTKDSSIRCARIEVLEVADETQDG